MISVLTSTASPPLTVGRRGLKHPQTLDGACVQFLSKTSDAANANNPVNMFTGGGGRTLLMMRCVEGRGRQ